MPQSPKPPSDAFDVEAYIAGAPRREPRFTEADLRIVAERARADGVAASWPAVVEVHDAHCRPRDAALEAVRQVVEADAAVHGGPEYTRGRADVARAVLRTLNALTTTDEETTRG